MPSLRLRNGKFTHFIGNLLIPVGGIARIAVAIKIPIGRVAKAAVAVEIPIWRVARIAVEIPIGGIAFQRISAFQQ